MTKLNMKAVGKLANVLMSSDYNAIVVGPSPDLEFLTGLSLHPDERFKALIVKQDMTMFAISPKLYLEEIAGAVGREITYVWDDKDGFIDTVAAAFMEHGLENKRIALNDGIRAIDIIDLSERFESKFFNGHSMLESIRLRKTDEEIENLRQAGKIADISFATLVKEVKSGMKEGQVAKRLEELMIENGAHELSFGTIVASGPNASLPHYSGSSRVLQKGDAVIIDFGCRYNGYCSDMTRTIFIGQPTEEARKLYQIVLGANIAGENAVRRGALAQDVDRAARSVIEKAGYGEYFITRTGHGLGVAVHEAPYIREGNEQLLADGMVFSVEPGIYIPGKIGIRIEDIVAVTENGFESMNLFSKDMLVIE